jgi:hypothetical protein
VERAGADQDRDFFAGIENIGGPSALVIFSFKVSFVLIRRRNETCALWPREHSHSGRK